MGRQRRRIDYPRVRNVREQSVEKALAERLPPKIAQVPVPKQGEKKFLLKDRFRRRGEPDAFLRREIEERLCVPHVRTIEQFKEPVNPVAFGKTVER